jgi:hypothetical protein
MVATVNGSRRRFLRSVPGGGAVLLLPSCGGGDSGPPAPAVPCTASAITANHGHALTFSRADLDSTTDKVYSIMATAPHDHTVTLTPAMLATLRSGMPVTLTSSTGAGHTHDVTITCV